MTRGGLPIVSTTTIPGPGVVGNTPTSDAPDRRARRRRAAALLVALVVLLSIFGGAFLLASRTAPTEPELPLLNEVLFLPAAGQSPFVELKNARGGAANAGDLSLVNEAGDVYALPSSVGTLPGHGFLLIVFDGQDRVDAGTVHADRTAFPNSSRDNLLLREGTEDLDKVAWGENETESVKLTRGGFVSGLEAGTTIGRFPASADADARLDWTIFHPSEATPGSPNPMPEVAAMLPGDGASFDPANVTGGVNLAWYPTPGADFYRIELAVNASFESPLLDEVVAGTLVPSGPLAPGTYVWRVQAGAEDGSAAAWSPTSSFSVLATRGTAVRPLWQSRVLDVDLLWQRKDSNMLLMESNMESGDHSWDAPHAAGSYIGDPAEADCGFASMVMIHHYFALQDRLPRDRWLTQDRLEYQVFKDRLPGPERDLNYDDGSWPYEEESALTFALGARPIYRLTGDPAAFWGYLRVSIDDGLPLLINLRGPTWAHVVVGVGYEMDGSGRRYVLVNNPNNLMGERYPIGDSLLRDGTAFTLPPRSSIHPVLTEAELGRDSDGDGVNDFDEIYRFHTDPFSADSDGDQVHDKDEIRATVFDPTYGYGVLYNRQIPHDPSEYGRLPTEAEFRQMFARQLGLGEDLRFGRDFDLDGKMMELDPDSDGGGCPDGMEDRNRNGAYDGPPESWNFDSLDDYLCYPPGTGSVHAFESWSWSDGAGTTEQATDDLSFNITGARPTDDRDAWRSLDGIELSYWVVGNVTVTYVLTNQGPVIGAGWTTQRVTVDCVASFSGYVILEFAHGAATDTSRQATRLGSAAVPRPVIGFWLRTDGAPCTSHYVRTDDMGTVSSDSYADAVLTTNGINDIANISSYPGYVFADAFHGQFAGFSDHKAAVVDNAPALLTSLYGTATESQDTDFGFHLSGEYSLGARGSVGTHVPR